MYKSMSLLGVAESDSSFILLVIALVVPPLLGTLRSMLVRKYDYTWPNKRLQSMNLK